ncbi:MAG: hypothetical protein HQL41_12945 [Alphaproteobacteria bacterium]|nr:hypothetical protein [Alphaproteobacteria bacterium]
MSDPLDPLTVSIAEPTEMVVAEASVTTSEAAPPFSVSVAETVIVPPRFSYSFFWGQLSFR